MPDTVLVLIPGLNNSPRLWNPVRDELSAAGPSIACQVVECAALPSVEDIARDILLRCPERFFVCGFSFGGYVALAMLALAPERIAGLALVSTSGLPDTAEGSAYRRKTIAASRAGHHLKIALEQRMAAFHPSTVADRDLENTYRTMVEEYGSERFEAHMQACIDRPDRMGLLQTTTIPALVVAATDDRVTPRKIQVRTAQAIPGAQYVEIEGAGHMLPIEQPRQLANALRKWLREAGTSWPGPVPATTQR